MANFRDGSLEQGQAMPAVSKTVLLVADNTAITIDKESLLFVGSDNTTATNRTFTLSPSTIGAGHKLMLQWNTGSSTTGELADSGTMKLVSAWLPVQYDTLELIWDGTNWCELARGNTTGGVPTIPLASARLLVGSSAGLAAAVDVTGDVTISNAGVTAIASGVIVNADVKSDAAIVLSKLEALSSARLIVGSSGNVPTAVDVTGDVTISNAGVTAIASGAIVNADVNASAAIDYSKMATMTGDVTMSANASTIGSGVVTLAKIATAAKPIYHVVGAGIFTTLGGDANESITVTNCLGTDTAVVWVQKAGATPRTVDTITPGTGSVDVVLSGDPSTDHKLAWIVVRAAA